ncbi:winged helix-turn-helix transcriptional regulator [Tengunoibacter tsumagoiensis]|nr:helix-turn-helix domain-containing protein [Tengunoibacter tsumagoiensis]
MNRSNLQQTTPAQEQCTATPLGHAIRLLGDEWILLIVMHLLPGPMRFNALRTELGHISSKTLSQRLKGLEELGFIRRDAFLEIPPRVEYQLTEQGQELGAVIEALEQFGKKHLSGQKPTSCSPCALDTE